MIGTYTLLLFYILAAAATFVDLLIILHLLLPSQAFQVGFSHKSKHSFQFENTTSTAISNCCKVQNHPSSSCNKRKMTQKMQKPHLTNANGQHHKNKLNLWTMSLICPLLWVISSSVDRDPSRSQHYLNSGVSVYECIIQSLANSLKSTSSRTHWDPVSLQGASCFTLRSRSLSWQLLAFSSLKK